MFTRNNLIQVRVHQETVEKSNSVEHEIKINLIKTPNSFFDEGNSLVSTI